MIRKMLISASPPYYTRGGLWAQARAELTAVQWKITWCLGCRTPGPAKRYGAASTTEEEYTNLSLDLLPRGGTVEEMLHHYLKSGGCFSLVSTISHVSYTAGCDVNVAQEDPSDRWFTYNDEEVTETTGKSVCDEQKNISYILFYKRHDQMVGHSSWK
ncbi:hypothetical protein D5F01_LYC21161 [Larimichthys crocea]|uniref:Uncharacterized protein n=1 Tax=Larimichthys crocea TaxID=215358 RepID=A0A6G0HMX2_LARCR|nr:hypothetical protein D5F01_LYC21161 [Larimichthys crocea]